MSEIFVLDGADVPNPEDMAMLASLYSRSPRSVMKHLEKVKTKGSAGLMSQYYCGYGHKSIGDCGTVTIYAENVSMLASKAIQDTPLYNGQEASTRYLDMSKQEVLNPQGSALGQQIQEEWIKAYSHVLSEIVPELKRRFPIQEGQDNNVWSKAIKARAFDIARSLLPAGCTTYVAWHTNLRQAHDHLSITAYNPLPEISQLAADIRASLSDKYPSSFSHNRYAATEDYLSKSAAAFAYYDGPLKHFECRSFLDLEGLSKHRHLLESRPPKTELHQRLRQYGNIKFSFSLDFGSYRDLQRQRSAVQEMPLLTTKHGFHTWYLDQLTPELRRFVVSVLREQESRIAALGLSSVDAQYYVAIGYVVPVEITCPLPAAVYIAELRSSDAVHPTLREQAQRMGDTLKSLVPGLTMHHDTSPGSWNIRRGTHDIVEKPALTI